MRYAPVRTACNLDLLHAFQDVYVRVSNQSLTIALSAGKLLENLKS